MIVFGGLKMTKLDGGAISTTKSFFEDITLKTHESDFAWMSQYDPFGDSYEVPVSYPLRKT